MRDAKCLAAETIQEFSVQRLPGGKADRMHKAVKTVPMFAQIREYLIDVVIACDVTLENQLAVEFLDQIQHTIAHPIPLIGKGQFRALAVHGLRYTVRDRTGADHAGNQKTLVGQKSHFVPL